MEFHTILQGGELYISCLYLKYAENLDLINQFKKGFKTVLVVRKDIKLRLVNPVIRS